MNQPVDASPPWLAFAREVIETVVRGAPAERVPAPSCEPRTSAGAFVTLHKFGRLRGCMGTLDPTLTTAEAVRRAAVSAAMHDPRFAPLAAGELANVIVEVSLLSEPWPMRNLDELERGRHGVIVRRGLHQGLFLPQVATDHNLDKETFLSRCCSEKANLPPDAWRDPETEVLLFTTTVFSEAPAKP